ncbi:MAG: hypothetical protein ACYTEL_07865 [Planctomycetota bacterium]
MDAEKQALQVLENLPFLNIFKTFRMAVQPKKLLIALLAVAVISGAGLLLDLNKTVVVTRDSQGTVTKSELSVYTEEDSTETVQLYLETHESADQRAGVFLTLWHFNRQKFHAALHSLFSLDLPNVAENIGDCFEAVIWVLRYHPFYCAIFFVIKLAVISVAGGAICRIAALQFAQGEKPGLTEALRFSANKFLSFFTAPLLPLLIIILVGMFVVLLGVFGCIIPRVGELMIAVFMLLALLAAGIITAVVIGAVAGFNLMFPAVAYDGSDCLDAMSRSLNYIYSRPWRMGFYTCVAAVYGAICYVFVRLFAFLLLLATYALLDVGIWGEVDGLNKLERIWVKPTFVQLLRIDTATAANLTERLAAYVIYVILLAVIGLVISFIISFYFSANTIIYALMRSKVDNTALDDIYTHSEGTEAEATRPATEPEPRDDSQASQGTSEAESD